MGENTNPAVEPDPDQERGMLLERWGALLEAKKLRELKAELAETNAVDAAEFLGGLDPEKMVLVFRTLPKGVASDVFAELEPEAQQRIISAATDRELGELVEGLFVDDAVDMLEELPANVVKRVLKSAQSDTRQLINQFLNYPENSVGSIMTAEYVSLKKNMDVSQAIASIRRQCEDSESIYTCYVTDSRRILLGVITLKDLLMARDDQLVEDIMDDDVITALTTEDQEEAVQRIMKYDFLALPVVDLEGRLVGIVTVDDVMDVMEEEATEDIEKMAAITPSEKPYFRMTTFETYLQRIPWLLLLMVSATFTGMIITSFEGALAAQVALTAFIPMLMDTGGNSGSQSSVTVIRALSLGDVELGDVFRVIGKEVRVAVMVGLTLAAANFAKIMLVDGFLMRNPAITPLIAGVVCMTLVVTVAAAQFVGCSLPILAKKLGFDPAVMASPFITTIVDAISLLVYFTFAKLLLGL